MYHSLIFWDGSSFYTESEARNLNDLSLVGTPKGTHTWNDWFIIPSEKPSIALPGFEVNSEEIFGRSGSIDMTHKAYSGQIPYQDRTGNLQFYIDHERIDWKVLRKKIVTALHGKVIKMVLEDDPGYYFIGRFALTDITPGASYSKLTLSYQLDPYRYPIQSNSQWGQVYWDPFNFDNDYDLSVDPNYHGAEFSSEGAL